MPRGRGPVVQTNVAAKVPSALHEAAAGIAQGARARRLEAMAQRLRTPHPYETFGTGFERGISTALALRQQRLAEKSEADAMERHREEMAWRKKRTRLDEAYRRDYMKLVDQARIAMEAGNFDKQFQLLAKKYKYDTTMDMFNFKWRCILGAGLLGTSVLDIESREKMMEQLISIYNKELENYETHVVPFQETGEKARFQAEADLPRMYEELSPKEISARKTPALELVGDKVPNLSVYLDSGRLQDAVQTKKIGPKELTTAYIYATAAEEILRDIYADEAKKKGKPLKTVKITVPKSWTDEARKKYVEEHREELLAKEEPTGLEWILKHHPFYVFPNWALKMIYGVKTVNVPIPEKRDEVGLDLKRQELEKLRNIKQNIDMLRHMEGTKEIGKHVHDITHNYSLAGNIAAVRKAIGEDERGKDAALLYYDLMARMGFGGSFCWMFSGKDKEECEKLYQESGLPEMIKDVSGKLQNMYDQKKKMREGRVE